MLRPESKDGHVEPVALGARPSNTLSSISNGRPRALLATLMLGYVSQTLAFTVLVPAFPQMAHDLGHYGQWIAQMSMAMVALGQLVGSLASSWFLQRTGTRTTLLGALLSYAAAGVCGIFLSQYPVLLLASCFVLGASAACMVATCVWGISIEYDSERRARILGVSNAMAAVTGLVGTLLGGYLAQMGWSFAFVAYVVFGLVGLCIAFNSIKQIRQVPESRLDPSPVRAMLLFYLMVVVGTAVLSMGSIQVPFLLAEDGIHDAFTRSRIISTFGLATAVASYFYGPVRQRLGDLGACTLALVITAVALASIGWGANVTRTVAGALLAAIGAGLLTPSIYCLVSERTTGSVRTRAIAALGAFACIGIFLNPLVFGPLSVAIGSRDTFLIAAVIVTLLASGAGVNLARRRELYGH